jgi:predicted DNA-binding transcriptional regulator AlpA
MEQMPQLLKVPFTATNLLKEKPAATYQKIASGVFPVGVVVRLGPRSIRFNREKLLAWLESGGSQVETSSPNADTKLDAPQRLGKAD